MRHTILFCTVCCSVIISGCFRHEKVARYTVPKPHVVHARNHVAGTDRMLAAIVPLQDRTWFFKVTGQDAQVAAVEDQFRQFLASLKFENPAEPTWKLPEGWREGPGSQLSHAVIEIGDGEKRLEMTVTPLSTPPQTDTVAWILDNVNRWRGQLHLGAIEQDELPEPLELEGTTATVVNLLGRLTSGGMGSAPFAGTGAAPFAGGGNAAAGIGPPTAAPRVSYDVPEGWSPSSGTGISVAAFEVSDEGKQVGITVTPLPLSAGDLLANVNRWCQQIQAPPLTSDELGDRVKQIELKEQAGNYVELVGPEQTILGVIFQDKGRTWFIKLIGDKDLAQREQQRFEQFVRSILFQEADGAAHGN